MSEKQDKMVGVGAADPHKNTATCKKVNDRLRRRKKRQEREALKLAVKSGSLLANVITIKH
jgi:hypothetical protein